MRIVSVNAGVTVSVAYRFHWLRTLSYGAGAHLKIDDGSGLDIDIVSHFVEVAEDGARFEKLSVTGPAVIQLGTSKYPPAPLALGPATTSDVDNVAAVAGTSTQLLPANPARRQVTLQNLSTSLVYVSKSPAVAAAAGIGAPVIAVLAPCGVAGDGTGGTLTLAQYAGPIYAAAAVGGALVAVGAY